MGDYVTSSEVSNFGHEFAALSDSSTLLTAASRLFDNLCEVDEDFFAEEDGTTEDKIFVGDGTAYLKLPPYVDLDSVAINEGTIADVDYTTDNVPEYIERGGMLIALDKTKRTNFSPSGINRFEGWPDGKQIRVSAIWGFVTIPADVKLACVHLAFQLWRLADPSFSIISGVEGAQVANFKPAQVAQSVIDKYRMKYSQRGIFA